MQQAILGISTAIAVTLVSSACSTELRSHDAPAISDEVSPEIAMTSSVLCFRHEVPYQGTPDNPNDMDVEELIVMVEGDRARGEYNWLPAYRGQRLGSFSGSFEDNLITATYDYEQEGQSSATAIVISLEEDQASVEGGPPELGLNRTLPQVECQNNV